jgi:hypothetical protein
VGQFANLQFALTRYSGAWGKQIYEKKPELKFSWHCPFKPPFACTTLYRMKTSDSCCHSLPTGNYIPLTVNLLKGSPSPHHTHTQWRKYILWAEGGILRTIPRKCSPLAQIRREQKKPGPLLLVYFMPALFQHSVTVTPTHPRLNLINVR